MSNDIKTAWGRLIDIARSGEARTKSADQHIKIEREEARKVDGRTLQKTGRTEQLNVRVRAETKAEIQALANAHGWLIAEVIEKAVSSLKARMESGH